jgi:hypothetical protein
MANYFKKNIKREKTNTLICQPVDSQDSRGGNWCRRGLLREDLGPYAVEVDGGAELPDNGVILLKDEKTLRDGRERIWHTYEPVGTDPVIGAQIVKDYNSKGTLKAIERGHNDGYFGNYVKVPGLVRAYIPPPPPRNPKYDPPLPRKACISTSGQNRGRIVNVPPGTNTGPGLVCLTLYNRRIGKGGWGSAEFLDRNIRGTFQMEKVEIKANIGKNWGSFQKKFTVKPLPIQTTLPVVRSGVAFLSSGNIDKLVDWTVEKNINNWKFWINKFGKHLFRYRVGDQYQLVNYIAAFSEEQLNRLPEPIKIALSLGYGGSSGTFSKRTWDGGIISMEVFVEESLAVGQRTEITAEIPSAEAGVSIVTITLGG